MRNLNRTDFDTFYEAVDEINATTPNLSFSYTAKGLKQHQADLAGKSGIYYIYKIVGNEEHGYVGQAKDLYERLKAHINKAGKTTGRDSPALHAALAKPGEFKCEILEFTTDLDTAEQNYISAKHTFVLDPAYHGGYNLTPGGQEHGALARKTTVVQYDYLKDDPTGCDITKPLVTYITCVAAGRALFGDDYTDTVANNIRACANKKLTRNKKSDGTYTESKPVRSAYGYHWERLENLPEDIQKLAIEKIAN